MGTLNARLGVEVGAVLTRAMDVGSAAYSASYGPTVDYFSPGANSLEVHAVLFETRQLAPSATDNLDLSGQLPNEVGLGAKLASLSALIVLSNAANVNDVIVGAPNGISSIFGNVTDRIRVKPGGMVLLGVPDLPGYPVLDTIADTLQIANGGAGSSVTYTIIAVGVTPPTGAAFVTTNGGMNFMTTNLGADRITVRGKLTMTDTPPYDFDTMLAARGVWTAIQASFPAGAPILQIRHTSGLAAKGGGTPTALQISRVNVKIMDVTLSVDALAAVSANSALLGNITLATGNYAMMIRATGGIGAKGGGAPLLAAIAPGVIIDSSFNGLPARVSAMEGLSGAGIVSGEPWPEARIDFSRSPTVRYALPQHGQSNSIGPNTVLLNTVAQLPLRMLGSIRRVDLNATGQVWTAGSLASWGGFDLPAAEAIVTADGNTYGETGAVVRGNSMLDHLAKYIGANVGDYAQTLALCATGAGGRTADEVVNGYYGLLTDFITYANARAAAAGLTLRVPSVLYDQGEADMSAGTAKATYKSTVAAFPAKVRASQLSICGVDAVVPTGIFQTAKHANYTAGAAEQAAWDIAMAQRELAETHPGFFLAGTAYAWDYLDASHLYALGQAIKYARAGRAQAQLHGLGIRPPHLRVIRATWTASGIELQYAVPVGRLTLDTAQITNSIGFWYGGSFRNASNAVVPITAASLKAGTTDTITWSIGSAPASGWKFFLGRAGLPNGIFGGAGFGPAAGARTCIRDQAGDSDQISIGGISYPLHNWSPFYEFTKA